MMFAHSLNVMETIKISKVLFLILTMLNESMNDYLLLLQTQHACEYNNFAFRYNWSPLIYMYYVVCACTHICQNPLLLSCSVTLHSHWSWHSSFQLEWLVREPYDPLVFAIYLSKSWVGDLHCHARLFP